MNDALEPHVTLVEIVSCAADIMADYAKGVNVTTLPSSSVDGEDWLLLQPLWNLVLANRYYTASPLFLIFVADGFYFVCMVPYIVLDFYGLDHWDWVKRYARDTVHFAPYTIHDTIRFYTIVTTARNLTEKLT